MKAKVLLIVGAIFAAYISLTNYLKNHSLFDLFVIGFIVISFLCLAGFFYYVRRVETSG